MNRKQMIVAGLSVAAIAIGLVGAKLSYDSYKVANAYDVRNCYAPVLHLEHANTDVCIEPGISRVMLTFARKPHYGRFTSGLYDIKGIDIDNSWGDAEKGQVFQLVYYMSRTDRGEFIANVIKLIDDPVFFAEQD